MPSTAEDGRRFVGFVDRVTRGLLFVAVPDIYSLSSQSHLLLDFRMMLVKTKDRRRRLLLVSSLLCFLVCRGQVVQSHLRLLLLSFFFVLLLLIVLLVFVELHTRASVTHTPV